MRCYALIMLRTATLIVNTVLFSSSPLLAYAAALSAAEIAERIGPATVVVQTERQGASVFSGSGFLVDRSGIVITNLHVVAGATRIQIRLPTGSVHEVIGVGGVDKTRDLAVLKVSSFDFPIVELGNSDNVKPGHQVVVIGTALGILENTVTNGIISGIRKREDYRLFQMDAAVSPGSSGGPVVNQQGQVIGVTVSKLTQGESLNFAVPICYARDLLQVEITLGLKKLTSARKAQAAPVQQGQPSFAEPAQQMPTRWRSLNTGTVKILDLQGDFLSVQNEFPREMAALGNYVSGKLRKQGDRWLGTVGAQLVCVTNPGARREKYNTCQFVYDMEITSLTHTRIKGSTVSPPPRAQLNCKRCTFSQPARRHDFVWIPD